MAKTFRRTAENRVVSEYEAKDAQGEQMKPGQVVPVDPIAELYALCEREALLDMDPGELGKDAQAWMEEA